MKAYALEIIHLDIVFDNKLVLHVQVGCHELDHLFLL